METIDLDVEESNELAFRIKMEGVGTNPVKVRLVCESNDVSYMFNGFSGNESEVVNFILPEMKNKLQEGTYPARIEVLVDNRYFSPINFQINFKKTMKVFAESVVSTRPTIPEIKISAQPIVIKQQNTKQESQQSSQSRQLSSLAEVVENEKRKSTPQSGYKPSLRDEAMSFLKSKRK